MLLPPQFNDGRDVPGEWLADAVLEIVDVPDIPKNRQWMKAFKKRWMAKLDQLDLWMVSYLVTIE